MTNKDSSKVPGDSGAEVRLGASIAASTPDNPESAAFDVSAEGIDVEALMRKIRQSIAEKRRAGIYRDDPEIDQDFRSLKPVISSKRQTDRLLILRGYQDSLRIETPLSSHRPIIGPLIVAAKKSVLWFFKRTLAPIFSRQGAYNSILLDYLEDLHKDMDDLKRKVDRLVAAQPGQESAGKTAKPAEDQKLAGRTDVPPR